MHEAAITPQTERVLVNLMHSAARSQAYGSRTAPFSNLNNVEMKTSFKISRAEPLGPGEYVVEAPSLPSGILLGQIIQTTGVNELGDVAAHRCSHAQLCLEEPNEAFIDAVEIINAVGI